MMNNVPQNRIKKYFVSTIGCCILLQKGKYLAITFTGKLMKRTKVTLKELLIRNCDSREDSREETKSLLGIFSNDPTHHF